MLRWLERLLGRRKRSKRDEGAHWERVAARDLRRKGYKIVTRNWRGRRGEIDIVAFDGEVLVFVEVRSRGAAAAVDGYHSVTHCKRALWREACQDYLNALRIRPAHHRYDIVSISHKGRRDYELRHFERIRL